MLDGFGPAYDAFLTVDLDLDGPSFDDDRFALLGRIRPTRIVLYESTFVIKLSSKIKRTAKVPMKSGAGGGIRTRDN